MSKSLTVGDVASGAPLFKLDENSSLLDAMKALQQHAIR
jgi:hypothetical protein